MCLCVCVCVCVCVAGGGGRQQADGVCGWPESHQTPAATFRVPTRLRAKHTPDEDGRGNKKEGVPASLELTVQRWRWTLNTGSR